MDTGNPTDTTTETNASPTVPRAVYDDSVRRLQTLIGELRTRAEKAERELEQVTSWWRHEREVAGNQGTRANEAEAHLAAVAKLCNEADRGLPPFHVSVFELRKVLRTEFPIDGTEGT